MAHEEKIDYLLLDIRELEKKVAGMRGAEIYPVSFFSQSFELAHKILTDLHKLESAQMEDLSRQMEEHRTRLSAIPVQQTTQQPAVETVEATPQETMPPTPAVLRQETITEPIEEAVQPSEQPSIEIPEEKARKKENALGDIKASVSLNEILEKKSLSDFRKAFSLNDRFRFRRELFGGDEERMNKVIHILNDIHSYEESISFLHNELHWNIENEAVAEFLERIEKRFS
ncbi:hypothetical protein [Parabacteroides sp. PF5-6]|uniref:SPOR domain-containing protein n=1 Tax=Parabacteroides sp. PF5-6 TaxID=1742403 RepID=UPI002406785F|nr:hypothetical protein [Parabacteroides sp. PF5-6]MDF9829268.1 hypothetical protein [Parabacteroides sp. PF5-6]